MKLKQMINDYFKNRKLKVIEENQKLDELEYDSKMDARAKLKELTRTMCSMHCPINKNDFCWQGCIHFEEGWVYEYSFNLFTDRPYIYETNPPKCKLWRIYHESS